MQEQWGAAAAGALWRGIYGKVRQAVQEELARVLGGVVRGGKVTATALPLGETAAPVAAAGAGGGAPLVSRADHVHAHGVGYLPDAHHAQRHGLWSADHGDVDTTTAPSDGEGLVWDAAAGRWQPGAVGGAAVLTAAGDLLVGGAGGAATRLAVGAAGQVLTVDGLTGRPAWRPGGGGAWGLLTDAGAPGVREPGLVWTAAGDVVSVPEGV